MKIKEIIIPNSLIAIVVIFLLFNLLFLYYSPDQIIDFIGVGNSYLTVFIIASIGGLSSFTSAILFGAIATFASGGATPWLLGLSAGIGIFIGDSLIFGLLSYGLKDVSKKWRVRIESYKKRIKKMPDWLVYLLLLLILALTPIPNDIVLVALVLLNFQYLKIMPILFVSSISIATITAYLGESLFSYFF
jgi:hypothetical protein